MNRNFSPLRASTSIAFGWETTRPSAARTLLCGPILSHEVNSLLSAVESVQGVRHVDNRLEPHDQPGNIPSLQGGEDTTGVPQW